ncbi:MAG: TetR family transcriptional regulator [Betaproteobacteria bacterium]|jgi:AcrR family transcriptional regulator|nr:TetR family transcriptional regulator [Betaproteobacteria bacterium]
MARNASPDTRSNQDTRDRMFDAAEALFIERGFDGTSLRMVTTRAKVNLAAVNYHFGGKNGLFTAMIARRFDTLNDARVTLLDEYRRTAKGAPLACEHVLAAMFVPAMQLARDPRRGGRDFLRLLGRAYVDPSPTLRDFLAERYAPTLERFKEAFSEALPEIPRRELIWRLHFMMGALAYTLAGADTWRLIAALSAVETPTDELLLRRLAPFLVAGLRAPLPDFADPGAALAAEERPQRTARNSEARSRAA